MNYKRVFICEIIALDNNINAELVYFVTATRPGKLSGTQQIVRLLLIRAGRGKNRLRYAVKRLIKIGRGDFDHRHSVINDRGRGENRSEQSMMAAATEPAVKKTVNQHDRVSRVRSPCIEMGNVESE